jgi:hypothetical protein
MISSDRQTEDAKRRTVAELYQIAGRFPASLVVRLCTNEDDIVQFWNDLDEKEEFALDVVDDLQGEATEIAGAGNSFFVYTPALHRLREGGFNNRLFDLMDEKKFNPRQVSRPMPQKTLCGGCACSSTVGCREDHCGMPMQCQCNHWGRWEKGVFVGLHQRN